MNRLAIPPWYSRVGGPPMETPPEPRPVRDTMDTVAKLSLFVRMMDSMLELLEVARKDLGVERIDDKRGIASYDKENGFLIDSFNAENRQMCIPAKMPQTYTARRLGS